MKNTFICSTNGEAPSYTFSNTVLKSVRGQASQIHSHPSTSGSSYQRKTGEQAFCESIPTAWNRLPELEPDEFAADIDCLPNNLKTAV